jgi:hypothetical protein
MSVSNDGFHFTSSLGNSIVKRRKAGSLEYAACYDVCMKNIKEKNIQKTLWHIQRHCRNIETNFNSQDMKMDFPI